MPRMRKSPHPKTASLSKWRCFLSKCHWGVGGHEVARAVAASRLPFLLTFPNIERTISLHGLQEHQSHGQIWCTDELSRAACLC